MRVYIRCECDVSAFRFRRVVDVPGDQTNNGSQSNEEEEEEEEESGGGGGEEGVDPSEEALLQAFGETAVQGVTWLVNAMGLNLNQSASSGSGGGGSTGQQQQQQQQPQQPGAAQPAPAANV